MNADELGSSNPAFTIIPGGFGASEQNRAMIEAVLNSPAPVPAHSNVYTTTASCEVRSRARKVLTRPLVTISRISYLSANFILNTPRWPGAS